MTGPFRAGVVFASISFKLPRSVRNLSRISPGFILIRVVMDRLGHQLRMVQTTPQNEAPGCLETSVAFELPISKSALRSVDRITY